MTPAYTSATGKRANSIAVTAPKLPLAGSAALALVVAFFGGDKNDVIRLGVVALAVSLYNYPRRSAWQRAVDYFSAANAGSGEGRLGL